MAKQQDVQQQSASAIDGVRRAVSAHENAESHVAWLRDFLTGRGDAVLSGLLVSVDVVPEQEGRLMQGV